MPRSSKCITWRALGWAATAVVSGVLREPGDRPKKSTPLRTNSSTIRSAQRRLTFGAPRTLSLYSGAGIVTGSTPEAEWDEIEHKIIDFIKVLGLDLQRTHAA